MDKHIYNVGDHVLHDNFGEGLIVDVRERLFYDVLEVVFPAGVKKVTSIHPLLRPRPKLKLVRLDTQKKKAKPKQKRKPPKGKELAYLRMDPVGKDVIKSFAKGMMDSAKDYFLHLEAESLAADRGFDKLISVDTLQGVEHFPWQRDACRRVLRDMRGRGLLADEVGLGKTIEAMMVLKEYILRGLVNRALILVPASLVIQWQEELITKAGLHFEILGKGKGWKEHPFILSSLDTAKTFRNRGKLKDTLFDMVIVDEAHHLRNHKTLAWRFVSSLPSKYLLLLTATPVQNDLRELYNLVNLLRPGTLGTYRYFRYEFTVRGDKRLPRNTAKLGNRLKQVMIRTTRASTNVDFPKRRIKTLTFDLKAAERQLYEATADFIRDRYGARDRSQFLKWQFISMVLQKEIGSSSAAALPTLREARKDPRYQSHASDLNRLYALAEGVERHAKADGLVELIPNIEGKILIFTQFRATMKLLTDRLKAEGYSTVNFHGVMNAQEKERAIAAFKGRARVLVSTEAGGEGRNLQFCRTVINYDLPWNPMRLEQRIGRVHRLGQTSDVSIYNFVSRDTVEAHVLEILQRKINMFHLVIGEMDMILGNLGDAAGTFESKVFRIWAGAKSRKDIERGFEKLGDQLALGKKRYESTQELDHLIFD